MPFSGYEDFQPQFGQALQSMIAANPGISVYSGYRSPERQAVLYQNAIRKYGSPQAARKWVAPPGHSRHNKGIAADLRFSTPEVRQWAHENAADYGLGFRMGHEPWHIEPISAGTPKGGTTPGVPPMMPASQGQMPADQGQGYTDQGVGGGGQSTWMQSFAGQGGDWMDNRSYSADALLADVLAGHNPLRRMMYQKIMGLFA